jgi:hypothetical protein
MGVLKYILGDIIIRPVFGEKLGYLFNNSLFNVSTSGVGVAFTGANCARSFVKGVASPLPWCKVFYFSSAALSGVSCATSSICLLSGYSCLGVVPVITGSIAYRTSVAAKGCNALADCMDPAAGLSARAVDTCINVATTKWS